MTGYTETIRHYTADDRRVGILTDADGTGEVGLDSGEVGRRLAVRFTLRCRDNRIETVRFQVFGCGFTIAACAAAAEAAEGQALDSVQSLDASTIDRILGGLPEERRYCAELAARALHAAVRSAHSGTAVQTGVHPDADDHGPRVSADHPLYRLLIASPTPAAVAAADRHLFACLLAVATDEPYGIAAALGLSRSEPAALAQTYFPGIDLDRVAHRPQRDFVPPPEINDTVLEFLLSHVPREGRDHELLAARRLARILAARAAHPGHLWVAMGLFERPELTAAIRRILPSLAAANSQGMRWKRFLFKQVCALEGGLMCKSPDCGDCSDYALCFAPE